MQTSASNENQEAPKRRRGVKFKEVLRRAKKMVGNFISQLLVCLFALGICVGSVAAGLGLYYVFAEDKTVKGFIDSHPVLIIPFIVAEFFVLLALLGLFSFLGIGIILLWEGITDWESMWIWSEKSKRLALAAKLRNEKEEAQRRQKLASLITLADQDFLEKNRPRTLIHYISDELAKKEPDSYLFKEFAKSFEVFYRRKEWAVEVYSDYEEGGWISADLALDRGIARIAVNEEPIKPDPSRLKKFLRIPQDQMETLIADDYVKVADVRALNAAEVILRLRNLSDDMGNAIRFLGTDHGSIHLRDIVKTHDSKCMMITEGGFLQVNLPKQSDRAKKAAGGFTYVVEYFIQLLMGVVIVEVYHKSKNEPTIEDIGNFINQLDPYHAAHWSFVPKIKPVPYQVIKLEKWSESAKEAKAGKQGSLANIVK
jgi:hypothetical protein